MKKALVFDIQRFSTHDGDGIRTNIFFKGCPLRCLWCQNPEGISSDIHLLHSDSKCIHCGLCHANFPDVISSDNGIKVGEDTPEQYREIERTCPTGAMRLDTREYSLQELLDEVKKDLPFFRHGGGVTFSGGEPLSQYGFVFELADALRSDGIHTAIESSQFAPSEVVREEVHHFDTVFADIKEFDEVKHRTFTGAGNELILSNIRILLESGIRENVIIRTPLIPGYTATDDNISSIAGYISGIYPDVRYELLNYNPLAYSKYTVIGKEYIPGNRLERLSAQEMEYFKNIALKKGVKNILLGD